MVLGWEDDVKVGFDRKVMMTEKDDRIHGQEIRTLVICRIVQFEFLSCYNR